MSPSTVFYRLPNRTVGPGQRHQLGFAARELGQKAVRWALPGERIPGHISHDRLSRMRGVMLEQRPGAYRG